MPGLGEIKQDVPSRPSQVVNLSDSSDDLQRPNIAADIHSDGKSQDGVRQLPWGAKVGLS